MERIRWYPLVVMSVVYAVLVGAAWAAWGRAASGGPLSDPGGAIESASVDVGGTVTFGDVILRNNGSGPIHLYKVELLVARPGAVVEQVKVLDVDAVHRVGLIGAGYGFDPPAEATDVKDAVLWPSRDYEVLVAVRMTRAGSARFGQMRITYRMGAHRYVRTGDAGFWLCTPRGAGCDRAAG